MTPKQQKSLAWLAANGGEALLSGGQVAMMRGIPKLVKVRRRPPPDIGHKAVITAEGQCVGDDLVDVLQAAETKATRPHYGYF